MRRWLIPAALGILLAACGGASQGPAADPGDPATLGQRTFAQWCVPCHGANGEGFVNALNAPALNADGESHLLTDEAILTAIIDGGAASGGNMAPLGDSLTTEQEAAVLEYVHSLWSDEQRTAHQHER
jgi:mono/diheme cytochrome c family protein